MFNDDIITPAGVELYGNNLPISGCYDRIPRTIGRKVNPLMNIPLTGKRVPVLSERHRNMPDAAFNRPQTRNVGKEGCLHIEELSHFLYW